MRWVGPFATGQAQGQRCVLSRVYALFGLKTVKENNTAVDVKLLCVCVCACACVRVRAWRCVQRPPPLCVGARRQLLLTWHPGRLPRPSIHQHVRKGTLLPPPLSLSLSLSLSRSLLHSRVCALRMATYCIWQPFRRNTCTCRVSDQEGKHDFKFFTEN